MVSITPVVPTAIHPLIRRSKEPTPMAKKFLICEWTINPKEEEMGGLPLGELTMHTVEGVSNAASDFQLAAEDAGCDSAEIDEANQCLESKGLPDDGFTISNNEGHYIKVVPC